MKREMNIVYQKDKNRLEDIKDLKETIYIMRKKGLSQLCFILLYSIKNYLRSQIVFGSQSIVPKDVLSIWNEYLAIKKKENKIFNYLLNKKSDIDYFSFPVDEFLSDLDELSEQTDEYFEKILEDIEVACDMKEEYRAKRMPKDFDTLIENENFMNELVEGTIHIKDIIKFLKLPKKFIKFMKKDNFRIYELEDDEEQSSFFYGINYKENENEKLSDIKLIVPTIVDFETALINISEYEKAYQLYQRFGKKLEDKDIEEILNSAKDWEEKFKKEYCKQKIATKL